MGHDLANLALKLPSNSSLHSSDVFACVHVCAGEREQSCEELFSLGFFAFISDFGSQMSFGPIIICSLELRLIFTANTSSEVFAAVTISMSLSEMGRFVSCVPVQFELLQEHCGLC